MQDKAPIEDDHCISQSAQHLGPQGFRIAPGMVLPVDHLPTTAQQICGLHNTLKSASDALEAFEKIVQACALDLH